MFLFKEITDEQGKVRHIETSLYGKELLHTPGLNKGCAFTLEERHEFRLFGDLPLHVESMQEQLTRIYAQYQERPTNLAKNVFLNVLHDYNATLFYKLIDQHLVEMLPIIYTPTVADAVIEFSHELTRARGLYFSYPNRHLLDKILEHRVFPEIDLIVLTDGEGVLGIGDQGIGGMEISIAKLMVYTVCAGINPHRVLPMVLDVGTNNEQMLNDPMYLGWRHPRLTGKEYDDFIEQAVAAIRNKFPHVYLHWEDFGRDNARRNLERYRHKMCTFNDDMQGTGAITLATILAAVKASGSKLAEQRIVFFGAGTAGAGIADQIYWAMLRQGMTEQQARNCFWLIDKPGLLTDDMVHLPDFQKAYARKAEEVANWQRTADNRIELLEVVKQVKPTALIGCSTIHGAFTEAVVKTMAKQNEHPIIFPLSNPTEKAEAVPSDLYQWTDGKALVASGSPFPDIEFKGRKFRIAQCNNAFVFPGLGLGVIAAKATRVTNDMLWAACLALQDHSPAILDHTAPLLPKLEDVQIISRSIALAVANQAREEGVASVGANIDLAKRIDNIFWKPQYLPYKRIK